ncbi:MAG: GNAT family N-acetyltransferase [Ignavibacteriales bacterium]|nr:GNAT family N-acetyltransferase [Ignavibacteriales bacterium]
MYNTISGKVSFLLQKKDVIFRKKSMQIELKEIEYGSETYDAEIALRYEVLRKPLNLTYTKEQLADEQAQYRLGAFQEGALIGCLLLKPLDDGIIQMRQAAVANEMQRKGIGKKLIHYAEEFAKEKGFTVMILHAREYAIPFYEKSGYRVISELYTEVGLPHRTMSKEI